MLQEPQGGKTTAGGEPMKLTDTQLAQFHDEGYLFLPDWFGPDEVRIMKG